MVSTIYMACCYIVIILYADTTTVTALKTLIHNSTGTTVRQTSSSQSASGPSSSRPKWPKKRHADLPMDSLMERFLEQSAEAEQSFYQLEEQRLQVEDRRREAEHARELHMLQVLGQMFSSIATRNPVATATATTAMPPARNTMESTMQPGVPMSASSHVTRGRSCHLRVRSPQSQAEWPSYHTQPQSNPGSQTLGIHFSHSVGLCLSNGQPW